MKKIIYSIAVLMTTSYLVNAQVGINTSDPKVTLQVVGKNDNGAITSTDGILVPRVSDLAVNGTEDGQLVYLTTDVGGFFKGFHYWNTMGTASWTPIAVNAEIRKVTGGNIISSEAGDNGVSMSAGTENEDNIAIGRGASGAQTSGQRNVMVGHNSGNSVASPGDDNVYVGFNAGRATESSGGNIALGQNSLRGINGSNSSNSVAIGGSALNGSTISGGNNVGIGREAGSDATMASSNTILGFNSGNLATMVSNNIIFGNSTASGSSTNISSNNTIVGHLAGLNATMTDSNILIGDEVATDGAFDKENIFIGRRNSEGIVAGGSQNTSVGSFNLRKANIGNGNAIYGANVFNNADIASNNVAIGPSAGQNLKAESNNILIGSRVGNDQEVGSNNILIGNLVDFQQEGNTVNNTLNIQNAIFGKDNGTDGSDIDPNGKIGIGEPDPKERLDVAGAVKIGTNTSSTITDGSTSAAPDGGAGTIIFQSGHFFGWTGTSWQQLD